MLSFEETDDHYVVTQTTFSAVDTKVMKVRYSKDLKTKQVDDDPVRPTTTADVKWFEDYYRKHFEKSEEL